MQTSGIKLDKAYNLVNTNWFPYDQAILRELSNKIKDESVSKEEILSLLRNDASLFLLCLREVLSLKAMSRMDYGEKIDTNKGFLENASLEQLKASIKSLGNRAILHRTEASTEIQKQRLSEMIVSSQTANKLTEDHASLNEVVFSCSLMRQLGLTLIAWNYPRIFEKVTSKVHSKDSLTSEFTEVLGFSPTMLACTILEKWGLPKSFIETVGDRGALKKIKHPATVEDPKKDLFSRVSNICAVGEALARATNPQLYKTAEEDIELASEYIECILGREGVIGIVSAARKQLSKLSLEIPAVLQSEERNELDRNIRSKIKGSALLISNPYLASMPASLIGKVSRLYEEVIPNSPTYSSVSIYAKEIFPVTGFLTLQVYLFDPFERKLYPSLVLGKSKLLVPKAVYLKSAAGQYDILAEALKTKMPITHSQFLDQEEELTVLAASLGDSSTVGVVYMEMLLSTYQKIAKGTDLDTLKYFKALKILLSDCLGLK